MCKNGLNIYKQIVEQYKIASSVLLIICKMKNCIVLLTLIYSIDISAQNYGIDTSFHIGTGFTGEVEKIVAQHDGKYLVGGFLTSYNGYPVHNLVRLNQDGSMDTTFNIGIGFDYWVYAIEVQSDNKILCGGNFTTYNGVTMNSLVRLNQNGSIDTTFNSGMGLNINGVVYSVQVLSTNKILVGGAFTQFDGHPCFRIVQLNMNGSYDSTFVVTGNGFNDLVMTTAEESDGKILVGGGFTTFNSATFLSRYIARLLPDGTRDTTFSVGIGFNSAVLKIIPLSNGQVLVGGQFWAGFGGLTFGHIVRLNSNASVDTAFIHGSGFDQPVNDIALAPNGKFIVVGKFSNYNGISTPSIARLNFDGNLDMGFDVGLGFNQFVYTVCRDSNERILAGGSFSQFDSIDQSLIARIVGFCNYTVSLSQLADTNICENANYSIAVNPNPPGVYFYQWQRDGLNIPSANGQTLLINQTGLYKVVVTDPSSCVVVSNEVGIQVLPLPQISINTTQSTLICQGDSVRIIGTFGSGYSYQWYLNGSLLGGSSSNTIYADTTGEYFLLVTDSNGCSSRSDSIPVGLLPGIHQNDTTITLGQTINLDISNLYTPSYYSPGSGCNVEIPSGILVNSIDTSTGGSKQYWVCYGGNLTNPGSGSNRYLVDYGGTLNCCGGGGDNFIYVKTGGNFNSLGFGAWSGVNIVYYEPGTVINNNDPTMNMVPCSDIGVIYPPIGCSVLNFDWSTSETTSQITVQPTSMTTYYCTVSSSSISCIDSVIVNVVPCTMSVLPLIVSSNDTLFCVASNAISYQWYFDGGVLIGADSVYIIPNISGNYYCLVGDSLGCLSYTDSISFIVEVSEIQNEMKSLTVYPNPSQGRFTIDIKFIANAGDYISVCDIAGNEVEKINLDNSKNSYQLDDLAAGVYFINLGPGRQNKRSQKIVKLQ